MKPFQLSLSKQNKSPVFSCNSLYILCYFCWCSVWYQSLSFSILFWPIADLLAIFSKLWHTYCVTSHHIFSHFHHIHQNLQCNFDSVPFWYLVTFTVHSIGHSHSQSKCGTLSQDVGQKKSCVVLLKEGHLISSCRVNIQSQTTIHTHIYNYGQFRIVS